MRVCQIQSAGAFDIIMFEPLTRGSSYGNYCLRFINIGLLINSPLIIVSFFCLFALNRSRFVRQEVEPKPGRYGGGVGEKMRCQAWPTISTQRRPSLQRNRAEYLHNRRYRKRSTPGHRCLCWGEKGFRLWYKLVQI